MILRGFVAYAVLLKHITFSVHTTFTHTWTLKFEALTKNNVTHLKPTFLIWQIYLKKYTYTIGSFILSHEPKVIHSGRTCHGRNAFSVTFTLDHGAS